MNFNTLNTFLNSNPKLLSKYINVSMTVIGAALVPLSKVMKHCLVVQGLDPKAVPGEKDRLALRKALDQDLNKLHSKDFDDDYDFSWAKKALNKTQEKMPDAELTRETFKKMTDLSNLVPVEKAPSLFRTIADTGSKHETRLYPTPEEKEVKDTEPSRPTKFKVHPDAKPMPEFNTTSLKEALEKLKKYAAELDDDHDSEHPAPALDENDFKTPQGRQKYRNKLVEELGKSEIEVRQTYDAYDAKYPRKSTPVSTYRKGSFKRVKE